MHKNRARLLLESHLRNDERLIWYDVPIPEQAAARFKGQLILLTLWTSFACFWLGAVVWTAFTKRVALFPLLLFLLVGCAFVLIGSRGCLLALREIRDCESTAYGLTNTRALIVIDRPNACKTFTASAFQKLEHNGGEIGSVHFDWGRDGKFSRFRHGFYGIEQPTRVENLIREHLLDSRGQVTS